MLAAHDEDRARRVMHAVLADRAEHRLGQAAVAPRAHHEQVGSLGHIHQHLSGAAFHHARQIWTSGSRVHISVIASQRTMRASSWKSGVSVAGTEPTPTGTCQAVTASTTAPVSFAW